MKIATFNVNSIRKRLTILLDWLHKHQPDIMCLQETKVQDHEFPLLLLEQAGYHVSFRGMKGYNGVATLSKVAPHAVIHGFEEGPDSEDTRILQTTVNGISIINTYVPQGYKINTDQYRFKLEWFTRLGSYFASHLTPGKPVVWLGDLNIAPEPIDVYHAERRINDVDFHIDARMAFKAVAGLGFVDVFRKLHPDRVQYTYWDYFRNALQNNWGWRIDHIMVTEPLASQCKACDVDMEPRQGENASDHTVLWADFEV